MTSGGQCVMTYGTALMLLWSASSWDMHMLVHQAHCSNLNVAVLSTSIYCAYTAGRAYSNAHFGSGSGPIFLDDVQCTSSARKLLECYSKPILSHNCSHFHDAGVACEGIE